jgi:hypothetical protein
VRSLLASLVLLHAAQAAADPQRVALGTSDPNLRAALYVRGLDVVETPQPPMTLAEARQRATALDADAVVWLCDRGLCLYDRKADALFVRKVGLAAPLSTSDAAGVALSVQYFLSPRAEPAQRADAELPKPTAPPPPRDDPYVFTLEASGGGRVWDVGRDDPMAARLRFDVAWMPGRFGADVGLSFGPDQHVFDYDDRLADVTLHLYGRYRTRVAPLWLELDAGPAVHFLTLTHHMTLGPDEYRTDVSLDARVGLALPIGPAFAALRGGGFLLLTNQGFGPMDRTLTEGGVDLGLSVGFSFR